MGEVIPTFYSPPGMLDWPCGVERLSSGNTLIADGGYWSGLGSEVLEVDRLGRVVWHFSEGLFFAHSAKELKNGNILISDTGKNRVLEVERTGNLIWTSEGWGGGSGRLSDGSHLSYPNDAEGTTEGTILISDRNNNRIVEVDREGSIIWLYDKLKHCHDADRLPDGNTMVASSDENRVYEIDPDGKVVWSYGDGSPAVLNWPRDADRLDNGNTLIADSKNHRILEVDKSGKIAWSFDLRSFCMPYEADRLPNGNTLVSLQQRRQVIEVDPSGSIVWGFRNYFQGHIKEQLRNGDFEQESQLDLGNPAHWTKCPLLCEGKPPQFFWDSIVRYSGKNSIGLEYYGTGSVWWQQTVRVRPGKLYRLTDMVKTIELDGFAQTHVAFLNNLGGFFTTPDLMPHTRPRKRNTDWMWDSIEIRSFGESTAADIRCSIIGKGKAWFDYVVFEEVPWG